MSLLLDTQIALWWHVGHPRLNRGPRVAVEAEEGDRWVSRASLWEVAIKVSSGKLPLDVGEFAAQIEQFGFQWLEIREQHLLQVADLPVFADHKDPFDRLLVAQAKTEPLILLTADRRLARYGELVRVV